MSDLQWSGRAARWLFWRAPAGAAKYTLASNMALASDMGRRWLVFLMFGAYLWGLRWLAENLVPPLRTVSALLLLLWFWHGVNLVRWTLHARAQAARARALQRQQFEMIQQLPGQIQQWGRQAAAEGGQAFTMLGMKRQADPATEEHRRRGREQARQVRGWLGDEQDVPLGDEFEPLFRFPRRPGRKPKGGDGE